MPIFTLARAMPIVQEWVNEPLGILPQTECEFDPRSVRFTVSIEPDTILLG